MIQKYKIKLFIFGVLLAASGFAFTPTVIAHVAGTVINNSTWLNDEMIVPPEDWHVAPDEGVVSNAHGRVIVALLDLSDPEDPQIVTKQNLVPQSATNNPVLLPAFMGSNGDYTLGGGDLAPGKFRVIAWVDGNENGALDVGEPVGSEDVTLSGNAFGTSDADEIIVRIGDDSDADGMEDWWEAHWFKDEDGNGTLDENGTMDYDNDGLTNAEEYDLIFNGSVYVEPDNWDTDDDGMDDAWEIFYGLDPTSDVGDDGRYGDIDGGTGDGVNNYDEYTGPDGIGWRSDIGGGIAAFTTSKDAMNPTEPDSDYDGVDDETEFFDDLTHPVHSMSSTNFYPRSLEMSVGGSGGVEIKDPAGSTYAFGSDGGTVEFWIRPGTDGNGIIYDFTTTIPNAPHFRISLTNYLPKMEILVGTDVKTTVGGPDENGSVQPLDPDAWTHVACIIAPANNSLDIYIDGVLLIAEKAYYFPPFDSGTPFICKDFVDGYIDELRIWNYPRAMVDIEYWSGRIYPAPGYAQKSFHRKNDIGTEEPMYEYDPHPLLGYFRFDDGGPLVENFAFINYGLYPNSNTYHLASISASVTADQAVAMVGSDDADGDGLPEWWVALHKLEKYLEYYTSGYGPIMVPNTDDPNKIEGFEYFRSFVGYGSVGTTKGWQEDGGDIYLYPKTSPDFYCADRSVFTRYVYLFAQPVECPLKVFTPGMSSTIIYVNGTKVTTSGDEENTMQSYNIAQYMQVGRNMIYVECQSLVESSESSPMLDDFRAHNPVADGEFDPLDTPLGSDGQAYKFKTAVGKFDARLDCNGVDMIVRGDESRADPRSVWHCQVWSSFYENITAVPEPDQEWRAVPENLDYGLPLNAERDNNQLDPDTADDNLDAVYEYICGTNPRDRDSNNNGVGDGDEDFDMDGLVNREEQRFGSDPWLADSDDDGLIDGADVGSNGHPAQSLSPQNNMGFHFGGTQADFLEFPKEQRFALNKWTGEVWINPDSDEADGGIILQRSVSSNAVNYEIGLTAVNVPYVRYVSIGGTEVRADGAVAVTADGTTWTHIAASYYDSDLTLYINGTNVASTTGTVSPAIYAGGPIVQNIGRGFKGCIDELRLWNDDRTSVEIIDNRDEVLTGLESELVAYYRFDDNTSYTNLPPVVGTSANNGTNGANPTVTWTWGQVEDNVLKYSSDWQYQWKHSASFHGDVNFTTNHIITGPPRLQIFIQTDDAIDAGAQWSHNGGAAWNDSGYLETRLSAGDYSINFNEINGWITPSATNVTLIRGESTIVTSRYVKAAAITVIIDNNSDVKEVATWSLDGGIHKQGTGTKIEGLEPGFGYDIIFSDVSGSVPGWDRPTTIQNVVLLEGEEHVITASYTPVRGSLQITFTPDNAPSSGRWSVSGDTNWYVSGEIATNLSYGEHDIEYNTVEWWQEPENEIISIVDSTLIQESSGWIKLPETSVITTIINPSVVVVAGAKWIINDIIYNSGDTVTIEAGYYSISFKDINGWVTPATTNINLIRGDSTTITSLYSEVSGSLQIIFTPDNAPSSGRWRVSGDTNWYGSGDIVTNLSYGEHDVEYNTVEWWQEPNDEIISIVDSTLIQELGAWTELQNDDADYDNLKDWWELLWFGDLSQTDISDYDNDGLSNVEEYNLITNGVYVYPDNWDSDDDGMDDAWEIFYGLDPTSDVGDDGDSGDNDSDSIINYDEYRGADGVGWRQDSNLNGIAEFTASKDAMSPISSDSDQDGVTDDDELLRNLTHPVHSMSGTNYYPRSLDMSVGGGLGCDITDPTGSMYAFGSDGGTVEFWVYPGTDGDGIIYGFTNVVGNTSHFRISLDDYRPKLEILNGLNVMATVGGLTAPNGSVQKLVSNRWNHVACVIAPANKSLDIYVDGVLIIAQKVLINLDFTLGTPTICQNFGDGYLDELRIWSYPRAAMDVEYWSSRIYPAPGYVLQNVSTASGVDAQMYKHSNPPPLLGYFRFDDGGPLVENFAFLNYGLYPHADTYYLASSVSAFVTAAQAVSMTGSDDADGDGLPEWWTELHNIEQYSEYYSSAYGPFEDSDSGTGVAYFRSFPGYGSIGSSMAWTEEQGEVFHDAKTRPDFYDGNHSSYTRYTYLFTQPLECPLNVYTPGMSSTTIYVNGVRVTAEGQEANTVQALDIAQYMQIGRNQVHVECQSVVETWPIEALPYSLADYQAYNPSMSNELFNVATGKFDAEMKCNGVSMIVRGDESVADPRAVWHCQVWSDFFENSAPFPDQEYRAVPANSDFGVPLNAERDNNPQNPDFADDELDAVYEYICGTNPRDRDSNNNGVGDGDEDFDLDGLVNREEQQLGSDPWLPDSDDDGIIDGLDVGGDCHPAQSLSPQYNRSIYMGGDALDFLDFPKEQRFALTKWTAEAWIKPDSDEVDGGIILQRSVSSNSVNYEIGLTVSNTPYARYVSIGGVEVSADSPVAVVTDGTSWTHIAASYSDRNLILYVNGTNVASTTGVAFPALYAGGPLVQNIGRGFKGCIDDLRLWNDDRTLANIIDNKDEVLTGLESTLVAYYRFDDNTSYTNLPPAVGTSANNGTNGANPTVAWTWGQVEDNVLKYSNDWQYKWKHAASFNGDVSFTTSHIITGPPRLQVFIQTEDAIDAGAQWSRNGGVAWNDSGYLETLLSAGDYSINFNDIDGWITPSTTNVTLIRGESTIVTSRYVQTASITVIIDNNSDVKDVATWTLDGNIHEQGTGIKIEGLEPGLGYDIRFSDISGSVPGWDSPTTIQDVVLLEGEEHIITASYTPVRGSLQITFTPDNAPSAGRWRVSGDTNWYGSGEIVTNLSYGEHDVEYNTVQWWQEPNDEIIGIVDSTLIQKSRAWIKLPEPSTITTIINPFAAITAGAVWQLNGTNYNSGDAVIVAAGEHTVSFSDVDGWLTPLDVVATADNASVTVTGTYYRVSVLGEKGVAGVPGNLLNPRGVSVDEDIIYVADTDHHQVQTYNKTIGVWNIIGGEGTAAGQFKQPFAVNTDSQKNIWVADTGNHRIQMRDVATGVWTTFGTQGSGVGQFNAPYDVVVDLQGNVYVADYHNSRIQKRSNIGEWSVLIGAGEEDNQVRYPSALHIGLDGMLYVSDYNPASGLVLIRSFTRDGTYLNTWGWAESGSRLFGSTLMADGSLLVADSEADVVRRLTSSWFDFISEGVLLNPYDVASDIWGDMYIADSGNDRILYMPAIDENENGIPDIFENAPFGSGIGPLMKLSETEQSFSPDGGNNSFNVIGNVSWTASSDSAWVVITDGASGIFSGSVTYTVATNASIASRNATITVIGEGITSIHTIHQPVISIGNDFDGDRQSDLAVLDSSTGRWFIRDISGSSLGFSINWGWPGVEGVAGDYDGDGIDDLAVFDDNSGSWFIRKLSGGNILWNAGWGWPGVEPVSGDYNGDGIDDLAVFDQNTGRWFIRSVDATQIAWSKFWGWPGVQPVSGDYNGDGESDLAIFDQESGRWFIKTIDEELITWDLNWGWPGAFAVPGDYDGDGTSDLAVFDNTSGSWYIRNNNTILAWNIQWGWSGVQPVSGDFDGDGKSDLAIFDNNTGLWFIRALDGSIIGWGINWGWPSVQPIGK